MKKLFKPFYLIVVVISIFILVFYFNNSSITLSIQSIILLLIGLYLEDFGYHHRDEKIYSSLSFSMTILIIFFNGPLNGIIASSLCHLIVPLKQEFSKINNLNILLDKTKKIIFNISQGIINVFICDRLIGYLNISLIETLDAWKVILTVLTFYISNSLLINLIISFYEDESFNYLPFFKKYLRILIFSIILTPMLIYNYYDRGLIGLVFTITIIYCMQYAIIIHRKCIDQEKELLNDGLTEAYNYKHFQSIIDKKLKMKEKFTLIMIDLDDFKEINDTFGHLAGDFVLKRIVYIIKELISSNDILCRYGGDEFCIILNSYNDSSAIVAKVSSSIESFITRYDGQDIEVKSSIGFYNYDGGNITKEELIKKADKAMYRSKNSKQKAKI